MFEKSFDNKIYFVCYADGKLYENTQNKFINSYKNMGIDEIVTWNKKKLKNTNFYKKNSKLLNTRVGKVTLLAW